MTNSAKLLNSRPDVSQAFAYVPNPPDDATSENAITSLAGFSYSKTPAWPPLEVGRYFSLSELSGTDRVALVGPDVFTVKEGLSEFVEAFGERWSVIGKLARISPRTGKSFGLFYNVLLVPLPAFANIISGRVDNAMFQVFIPSHLSNDEYEGMLLSLKQAASGNSVSLRLQGDTGIWEDRLIAIGITVGIVGFALLNLLALVYYWVRRRSYELAIRLSCGASPQEVRNMLFWEQLVLVTAAYVAGVALFLATQSTISRTGLVVASSPVQISIVGVIAYVVAVTSTKLTMREIRRTDLINLLRGATT